jgi:hypothetical protein
MNILQDAFDSESFKRLNVEVISRKIRNEGYSLTEEQVAAIEEQISTASDNELTIELPGYEDAGIQISIEEEDIAHVLDEYTEKLSDKMPDIIRSTAEVVLANLRSRAPEMLSEHAEIRSTFEEGIYQKWGKALELLEMFIVVATEAGEKFNKEFRPSASRSNDFVFDVLTCLHARSCHIANEVLTLLKSGYADGAHARWRTMHEIVVVGLFVKEFGQDTAERYLLHSLIESHRAALQYQRHCTQLGYEPLTEQALSDLSSSYEQLVDRFGRSYAKSYGWAAHALEKSNPKFSDIEQAVELEHWRPHYKFASHNVHANPKGVSAKLGLYPESQELLLAGPSDTGFTDPAHSTAISLLQITTFLLTLRPNIDRLSICHILSTLAEEIGNTFLSIQRSGKETPQL